MTIQPIRTEKDHEAALERVQQLWGAKPDTPQGDELDVLATLIAAYEDRVYPMEAPTPVEAIVFRMEQQDLSRRDLEPLIGSRARVSEILNGTRQLTLPMIRRLNRVLGIPAEVLIGQGTAQPQARRAGKKLTPKPPAQPPTPRRAPQSTPPKAHRHAS